MADRSLGGLSESRDKGRAQNAVDADASRARATKSNAKKKAEKASRAPSAGGALSGVIFGAGGGGASAGGPLRDAPAGLGVEGAMSAFGAARADAASVAPTGGVAARVSAINAATTRAERARSEFAHMRPGGFSADAAAGVFSDALPSALKRGRGPAIELKRGLAPAIPGLGRRRNFLNKTKGATAESSFAPTCRSSRTTSSRVTSLSSRNGTRSSGAEKLRPRAFWCVSSDAAPRGGAETENNFSSPEMPSNSSERHKVPPHGQRHPHRQASTYPK